MMIVDLLIFMSALCTCIQAGDVIALTDSDFSSRMSILDISLVKFYAPWCGHCKKIAPEFEKAASVLKHDDPPITLIEVDCTEGGKDTCSQHGVSGYPTLQVFKNGEKAFDYEGSRESDGIIKYMRSKAGPSSRQLKSLEEFNKFIQHNEQSIIGFFDDESTQLNIEFQKVANQLSDKFRFAHTFLKDIIENQNFHNNVVIYQPLRLHTKLSPPTHQYDSQPEASQLNVWISKHIHGLVGHRTSSNADQFGKPIVIVYYDVDFVKNAKGSNYWRNRILKIASKITGATFAVASASEFSHELSEFGLTFGNDKPVVAAKNDKDQKFPMTEDFTLENFESFAHDFIGGKLKAYLKSEPVPTDNSEPVKVVVASQFDAIVNDESRDVLIEFYAPWCGHCKSLAPKYDELAKKLSGEDEIVIAKMDATANDVPPQYEVRGFPTIYFAPKGNKQNPKKYEGEREVKDFIKYLAREATNPLKSYDRSGKKIKTDL